MPNTKTTEIKNKITIPMYFYNIVIPNIPDYYSEYPVDFDIRPVACCPIHDEVTPSMRFYEETNTFYCFGCTAGGDVIELHRRFMEKLNGTKPSFSESVAFLYDYFIKGQESAAISISSDGKSIEYQSTVVEVLRLSRYTDLLENQLLLDTNIPEEIKHILWEKLDNIRILIRKNKINATNAMNYIKQSVKEHIQ